MHLLVMLLLFGKALLATEAVCQRLPCVSRPDLLIYADEEIENRADERQKKNENKPYYLVMARKFVPQDVYETDEPYQEGDADYKKHKKGDAGESSRDSLFYRTDRIIRFAGRFAGAGTAGGGGVTTTVPGWAEDGGGVGPFFRSSLVYTFSCARQIAGRLRSNAISNISFTIHPPSQRCVSSSSKK
jgi:hypothetical protein